MAKTVYSLVLDDEVMKLVDKAARRGGLSRSAYINQALAENVGYETALKKNADLFRCVEDLLARHDNLHSLRLLRVRRQLRGAFLTDISLR